MNKQVTYLVGQTNRWWSAPMRFTTDAVAALRRAANAPERPRGSRFAQTPVGIRSPLNAQ